MKDYKEETIQVCAGCGAVSDGTARFCCQCGRAFGASENTSYGGSSAGKQARSGFESGFDSLLYFLEQSDYIPYESEEAAIVGPKYEYYYGSKFREMRTLNQKVSFNWAALLFGVFWMLYRKMYGVAAAAIVATILAGALGAAGGAAGLALTVCYGLFGNYLYMMTVQKRVTELQKYSEPARSQYLEKYAGVSGGAVLIGLVVIAVGSLPFWMIMGLSFLSFLAI